MSVCLVSVNPTRRQDRSTRWTFETPQRGTHEGKSYSQSVTAHRLCSTRSPSAPLPYKGFWWNAYLQHYATAKTDTTPKRGAALPAVDMNALLVEKAKQEQAYEIEQYGKIPEQFKQECKRRYAEWGIHQADTERSWRIVVLDAYLGYDVERYRVYKREHLGRPREQANPYSIIEGLRLRVAKLEAELRQANQAG